MLLAQVVWASPLNASCTAAWQLTAQWLCSPTVKGTRPAGLPPPQLGIECPAGGEITLPLKLCRSQQASDYFIRGLRSWRPGLG